MRALLLTTALTAGLLGAGCPDGPGAPVCGASGNAGDSGVLLTPDPGGDTYTFGAFEATHARDCGEASTTISGVQVDPSPGGQPTGITLCVARGDLIQELTPIDVADASAVPQLEATAQSNCTWVRRFDAPPTGTITFAGYCDAEGDDFDLTFDGAIPLTGTCDGGSPVDVTVDVTGTVRVDFPAL
jgi:hypothetical protein